MSETWYSKIEGQVFSQIQYMLKDRENAPFPTLNCTTVNENDTPAQFPTLYLHELQPIETGQDLYNDAVNAVVHTVEVMAWSNEGQAHCKSILTETVTELKRLRYDIIMLPLVSTNDGLSNGVIRARRIIGANDSF